MTKKVGANSYYVKVFVVFSLAVLLLPLMPVAVTAENDNIRKVILHYYRFDQNYDEAGVWTWNNGTNGSVNGIAKSGVDDFGAVIEIDVDITDADPTGYFIPLSQGVPENTSSFPAAGDEAKDSYNNMDLSYDRTALIEGTVNELHLFFIEGNDSVFTNADERSMFLKEGFGTLTVLYYDPKSDTDETAYDNWDFWTWDTGTDGTQVFDGANNVGVPFQWELKQGDKRIKVGVINVAPDAQDTVGFIPKKGAWEAEWKNNGQDIKIDVTDIKGGGHKLVMYTAGDPDVVVPGSDPEFVPYDIVRNSGTYAVSPVAVSVAFNMPIEQSMASAEFFSIADQDGNQVKIESVEPKDADGKAFLLHIAADNALDKTKKYTVKFGEVSHEVLVDNNPPVINYTKKKDYVLSKGDEFVLDDFLRILAIDDRSGNLTDVMVVEGSVDTGKPGEYTLTFKAVDDWGNVGSESFVFTVTGEETSSVNAIVYAVIGIVIIVVVGAGSFFYAKKRKNKPAV